MKVIKDRGWIGLLMHFRGCSGRLNRLARSYHSGETGDAKELLDFLANQYPDSPVAATGYSLGGNMLLNLEKSVESRKSAQLLDSYSYMKKVLAHHQ